MTRKAPLGWALAGAPLPPGVGAQIEGPIMALFAPEGRDRLAAQVMCHSALDPFLPAYPGAPGPGEASATRIASLLKEATGLGQLTLALTHRRPAQSLALSGRERLRAGSDRLRERAAARAALAVIARHLPSREAALRPGRCGDVIDLLCPRAEAARWRPELGIALRASGIPPDRFLATGLWPAFICARALVPGDAASQAGHHGA